eukprot:TRINITY_DN43619_c0_g1_i1.p2 TRINITY_DN43619_c0_g1~~TRINITY_DN43619_c0_g1_i1.p2  ORF type:complete len:114 (+),score=42.66 TRINITY_DN43619_c0_g1_i1:71-412(+)
MLRSLVGSEMCIRDRCYWAMLAASTIGPGTITLMSRGGAEYNLQLGWTIILASFIAYCLQEAGARLQILQGVSFGEAMRLHFQSASDIVDVSQLDTPFLSRVMADRATLTGCR